MSKKERIEQAVSITERRPNAPRSTGGISPSPTVGIADIGRWILIVTLLFSLLAAQPAAAQETNPVCSDESGTLVNMIEGFIQLTTALGVIGLLVVWQADELSEMFTFNQERKQNLKRHKIGAMKSAAILVLLGPLFTIAGSMMELPIAQCVDLIPF